METANPAQQTSTKMSAGRPGGPAPGTNRLHRRLLNTVQRQTEQSAKTRGRVFTQIETYFFGVGMVLGMEPRALNVLDKHSLLSFGPN